MKKLIATVAGLLSVLCTCRAQVISDIRTDKAYLCAEGNAQNARIADSLALDALAVKVSATVSLPYSAAVKASVLRTYRDDLGRECDMLSTTGDAGTTVLRYIRRSDAGRIFDNRRAKVKEMLNIALTAEEKFQTDVALRYYSWAATLLRSLPPLDAAAIADAESRRDSILEGLNVKFDKTSKYNKEIVELTFTYKGHPVRNIDYSFFDGKRWSGILSAKDGKGFIEVSPDSRIDRYRIRYEITPSHLQHLFREVSSVEQAFAASTATEEASERPSSEPRRSAPRKIDFSDVKSKVMSVMARDEFQTVPDTLTAGLAPVLYTSNYEDAVSQVCAGISGSGQDISGLFTEEGYATYLKLIGYGNARVLNFDKLDFYSLGDDVFCRSVPMVFSFKGNRREFVEDVVFTFDRDGKISNLTFALSSDTVRDIISMDGWTEEARLILIDFLENYKTAYALKRQDYIASIFDDDALIITGRVLRNVKGPNEYGNNRYVTLTRHNKENYIKQLGKVFASQEYINIQFSDCEVMKLGKGEQLFGIKIRQEYFSATYSDSGYLFILVDLRDYHRPVIHVRTWQDSPDKEFGVIGPYNF